jgi:hypothetical protein
MGGSLYHCNCLLSAISGQKKIKNALVILLITLGCNYSGYSQTSSFSFSQISAGTEVMGPGRGAEMWFHLPWDNGSGDGVQIPAGNSTPGPNYYFRFSWKDIESDQTQGSYSWTLFDQKMHQAMDAHQMFSFGVMPICSGCGSASWIPTYLHNLMQAEPTLKDWYYSGDGDWIPNWNSNSYLSRYKALLQAIANHIASTSYQPSWSSVPIPYSSVVYAVDIRGYGNYGEWHTSPWYTSSAYPANAQATAATLQTLIDYNLQIFPNYPNVILMAAFTSNPASFIPAQVSYYALTATNNWGQIGWRRDNWGDPQYSSILENNPETYNGSALSTLIVNKYKYAPVTGEPLGGLTSSYSCGSPYCDIINEMNLYHGSSFGNGNWSNSGSSSIQSNAQQASRMAGYRIILTGGSMTTTLAPNSSFNITLNWQNIGLAPAYENWNVTYELRNSSGTAVWTGNSAFKVKLFQPSGSPSSSSSTFTLSGVSQGTYSLYLVIRDPNGYKLPFPLAITGRNSDGSYLLRSNVTVGSSSSPTANAGSDQTITLPTSSITLNGSSSSGSITSYAWTEVSGPNTASISSPSSATTTVTGLIQGVYTFKLSINGGASTDQVTVTVNAAGSGGGSSGSIFTTQTPSTGVSNDWRALELGTKFRTSVAGSVTGIRFYKVAGNSGTHTGELYNSSGTRLAQAVFSGESASGWQTVTFSSPVSISANTTYIAAYFSASGNYTSTDNYFTSAVTNGSVTALADGTDGPNGVYLYTTSPAYPTSSYLATNYWVDVVFSSSSGVVASAGSDQTITLPTSSTTLSGSGSTGTITSYLWSQVSGPNTATISTPSSATTNVSGLIAGTYVFKLSVNGGASTDQVNITVAAASSGTTSGPNIFTTQTPSTGTENDGRPLEVGVKFTSSVAGTITGIRFYKTSGNTGTHIGELYSSTGTRLAQATFSGETSSGWQQVSFSSPVSINANTVYVAACFSSGGGYTSTANYFSTAVVNGTLTALADGTSGVNGVYVYTSAPAFPSAGYLQSNYWVDVVFSSASGNAARQMQITGEVVTSDTSLAQTQPKLEYSLGQNYPNPFLQQTKFNYTVPSRAFVEIILYDMQGRLVKILVNEMKDEGNYVYELSTLNLPRGIYYYRMRSGYFVSTKKLMIL